MYLTSAAPCIARDVVEFMLVIVVVESDYKLRKFVFILVPLPPFVCDDVKPKFESSTV